MALSIAAFRSRSVCGHLGSRSKELAIREPLLSGRASSSDGLPADSAPGGDEDTTVHRALSALGTWQFPRSACREYLSRIGRMMLTTLLTRNPNSKKGFKQVCVKSPDSRILRVSNALTRVAAVVLFFFSWIPFGDHPLTLERCR